MATPNVDEFSCMTIITVGQHNNWCRRVPMDCLSLRGGSDQIAAIWPRRLFAPAATHGNTLTLSYVRWRHHLLPPEKPTADDCVARVSAILSAEGAPLDITRGSDKNPILWPLDVPSVR